MSRVAGTGILFVVTAVLVWVAISELYPRSDETGRYDLDADIEVEQALGDQQIAVVGNELDGPRDVVIFMHGYGGDHAAIYYANRWRLVQGLVDAGVVVASADAGGNAWGSRSSQEDYLALLDHVEGQFDVDKVVIVGESMGAIAGLNLTARDAIPNLVGWVGVSPVVDMRSAAASGPLVEEIAHDVPAKQLDQLDPARLDQLPVPTVVLVTPDDSIVPAETGVEFAERVGSDLIWCEGLHASAACHPVDPVLKLFS